MTSPNPFGYPGGQQPPGHEPVRDEDWQHALHLQQVLRAQPDPQESWLQQPWYRERGLQPVPSVPGMIGGSRPGRGALRRRTVVLIGSLVGVLLVAGGLLTWQPVLRQVDPPDTVTAVPGQRVLPEVPAPDRPGGYSFLQTNADGTPVQYDPCQTLDYYINPQDMPRGGESAIHAAARTISEHSGLALQYRGETTQTTDSWPGDLTGQPVLFSWSTAGRAPDLKGSVLGVGGSTSYEAGGRKEFRFGQVLLDAEDLDGMPLRRQHSIESVVTHELAHVVGLGHVDDDRELMSPTYQLQPRLGPGDRAGLARIGAGECHPR